MAYHASTTEYIACEVQANEILLKANTLCTTCITGSHVALNCALKPIQT